MKKMFKKSIACLVAVLMIASSLPFTALTAQAADTTLSADKKGVMVVSGSGRYNTTDKSIQVVNDREAGSSSMGYVRFDVSSYTLSSSDNASASYTFTEKIENDDQKREGCGLSVYYATKNISGLNDKATNGSSGFPQGLSYTTTSNNEITDFRSKTKDYLGLTLIENFDAPASLSAETYTATHTIDIYSAIESAKKANQQYVYICFMLTNDGGKAEQKGTNTIDYRGGNSTNACWSDVVVTFTDSTTISSDSFSAKRSTIDSKINQTKTFGSDVYKNNADSNYMKGVKISGDLADESQRNISNCDFRVTGFANQVAVYTGSGSDIRFPFMARNVGNKASNVAFFIDYVSFSNSTFAVGGSKWTRCNAWNDYSSNSDTSHDFSSVEGTTRDNKYFTANEEKEWKNYITYIGSGNTTNYYDSLSSIAFKTRVGYNGTRSTATVYNYNASLYVINYAPIKSLIEGSEFKNKYQSVKSNESIYDAVSLGNYYDAVINLLNFDVMSGISSSNAETTVPQKGTQIKQLLEAYNSAVSNLKHRYTFVKVDGSKTRIATNTESVAKSNAPANTDATSKVSNGNGQHTWKTYSWPTSASNYTFTEVATTNSENCTGGTATCTKKAVCTVCGAEYGELAAHQYNNENVCTICGNFSPDLSAYNSAYNEVVTIAGHSNEYTTDSFEQYRTLYLKAVENKNNAKTQTEVDNATAQLLAAKSVLRKTKCTVTVIAYDKDGNKSYEEAIEDVEYGSARDIDIVELTKNDKSPVKSVEKWTITTDDGKTITKLDTLDTSVTLYVTKDVTITAFASNEASDSTSSKVVFLGINGRVVKVEYLAKGAKAYDTSTVSAPAVPFYTFTKWDTDSVTADGSGKTIYVRAEYSCTSTDDMCTVHFNGETKQYSYDSYVRPEGIDPTKQYALSSDGTQAHILTYLKGVDFYAPKTKNIYVIEVSSREAKIGITGSFSQRITEGGKDKRAATFNCKFYLPEDCTLVEWGAEISANGQTQVVKGENISSGNEYSITMKTTSPASSLKAFTGVAYVTYKIGDKTVTIKSDSVEQVLVD